MFARTLYSKLGGFCLGKPAKSKFTFIGNRVYA